jgi:hypothetical protein
VQGDPGMAVLSVVVGEEKAAEIAGLAEAAEFSGECRAILERLELRFRVGVVVGYVRTGMRLRYPKVREQIGDWLGCHGGPVVGVHVIRPGTSVGFHGVLDELFREVAVLGGMDFPVDRFPGVDVDHDVQVEVEPAPFRFQFRYVPGPYLVRAVGDELGADAGRVGGLGTAVADLVAAGQDPVHGADAAVVAALVEQDGPGLGRRLVGEPVAVEGVQDLLSFLSGEGGRVRCPLAFLFSRCDQAGVFRAPQGGP